jgi:hypothetical protein
MSRFSSFNHVPAETRRILRDRFFRKLHVVRQHRFVDPKLDVMPEQLVLRLLASLTVSPNAEWSTAETTYASAAPRDNEPSDLQALADLGWLRRVWGRVGTNRDLRVAVTRTPAGTLDAFKVLLSGIHDQRYEARSTTRSDPELTDLLDAIEAGRTDPVTIVSRTPEWVAARLWEIVLEQEATPDSALRRWADLWALLHYPSFVPAAAWSASHAETFRETALRTVASDPALGNTSTKAAMIATHSNHVGRRVG